MEFLNTSLLIVAVLGLAYCAKLLRSLHGKLNAKTNKIFSEVNTSAREQRKSDLISFRQTEAYFQLLNLLEFKAPVPPTRGWASSPDLLLTIAEVIMKKKPALVVELGSGVSTLVSAKSGARKVVSLDNSEEFGGKTRELIKAHKARGVEIRIAPLQPYANGSDWYDISTIKDLRKIDVLIIDGPPGYNNPEARYPALKEFIEKLSKDAVVIIDDVNRQGERKLAEDFAKALPNHHLIILDHEKGTAVISPR
jgi:predicted O-methyltransferase YrrM